MKPRRLRRLRLRIVDTIDDLRHGQLWLGPILVCTRDSHFRAINDVTREELRNVQYLVDRRLDDMP